MVTGRAVLRKALLAIAFASLSAVAVAEWVPVGTTSTSTFYYDPATIKRSGVLVDFQNLVDMDKIPESQRGKAPYASTINFFQIDCLNNKSRIVKFVEYAGPMATGKVLLAMDSPVIWDPVEPNSVGYKLAQVACKK
jgi:hypothetical protein